MKVVFTAAARRELVEVTTWFEQNSALGGDEFAAIIRETIDEICELPLAAPRWHVDPRFRARIIRRINYRVFYTVTDDVIRIYAIAHTSRDPGYWRRRLT